MTVHYLVGSSMVFLHLLRKNASEVTESLCRWIGDRLSVGCSCRPILNVESLSTRETEGCAVHRI
jgi:hypothetical protein